jgi:molybdopterin-guanine dinucleotide biosynthesis protein A
MTHVEEDVLGAVLAGGRSSRFGSDKAVALAHGKSLLAHAIETLRQVTTDVVICGGADQENRKREQEGATVLIDRPAPDMGPLAGLNAALHHGRSAGFKWVLSLACDTPFVPLAVLSHIVAQRQAAFIDRHAVIGLWPTSAGQALDELLTRDGSHSLRAFTRAIAALPLDVPVTIANFNFAKDLEQWLAEPRDSA